MEVFVSYNWPFFCPNQIFRDGDQIRKKSNIRVINWLRCVPEYLHLGQEETIYIDYHVDNGGFWSSNIDGLLFIPEEWHLLHSSHTAPNNSTSQARHNRDGINKNLSVVSSSSIANIFLLFSISGFKPRFIYGKFARPFI